MPNKSEYIAAANVPPSKRTAAQQALVSRGSNMQDVRNADHKAKQQDGG